MNTQQYKSAGFTLIEMLIALLVLSIGLLGVAALQTTGQRFNHSAYVRTQATFLAYDLMDRIRTNPVQAANGAYGIGFFTSISNAKDCATQVCTPAELKDYDLSEWGKAVGVIAVTGQIVALPNPEAGVAYDAVTRTYTVTLRWQEERNSTTKVEQQWIMVL
ncbi:type IV pilus modification protein PilV [Beggiatoa alba B18LD]|uniref:Type IV pilus modification protein PilV n=1 Tax=Beggiatoa alba B18LD TaxID=395493 RepID=I3CJU6_9GAMM|nr:type IV pilus modification protein PilV [Beggiatoa alba]EIJ43889.1 type IV pilus modification protein PilV [Beggiatoa alba B18LD]